MTPCPARGAPGASPATGWVPWPRLQKTCTGHWTSEPDDPSAHYWRGLALRDAGDNHAALAAFDAAIRLNERYTEAYVARGKAHSNLGDMAAARSDWAIAAQMLHHSH